MLLKDTHRNMEVSSVKERRKYNRTGIQLHVRLNAINAGKRIMVLDLTTRDISYSGTFIPTLTSFPEGTRFSMNFTLPSDNLEEFRDIESMMDCKGNMVRSDSNGIAIQFDEECRIEGLKAL